MRARAGAYGVWADFLEAWGAGEQVDPAGLPALDVADLPMDTWQRFAGRYGRATAERLDRWYDALARAIGESGDEFSFGRALTQARAGLGQILQLTRHPGLPEVVRSPLEELLIERIRRHQEELGELVEDLGRTGVPAARVEGLRRAVRDNPLTVVLVGPTATGSTSSSTTGSTGAAGNPWAGAEPGARPRRRLSLD